MRFEGVRFHYGGTGTGDADGAAAVAAPDVLAGIDLELRAGTSTALVGVNGAGKSTLVSLLARLRDPTAGRVTVDGMDVREFAPARWQRTIALMPQDPVRYPLTAYDNVAFGALEHADDRDGVQRAARLSGFASVVEELPKGWDTVLARELPDGAELSGGQWQRLALARALFATFHGARILVLDEPTAALDVRAEARFYQRFHKITAGADHAGDLAPVRHRPPRVPHLRARRRRHHRARPPRRAGRGRRHLRDDVPPASGEVRAMTDQATIQPQESQEAQPPEPPRASPPGPTPRRLARLAAILFFDGFRAAPGWMALVTAMLVLGSVAGTC